MTEMHEPQRMERPQGDPPDAPHFFAALDVLDHGLAFVGRDGALAHANRCMMRLLEAEFGPRLRGEIQSFARDLWADAPAPGEARSGWVHARDLVLSDWPSRMKGGYLGFDLVGTAGIVLVSVEPPIQVRLSPELLHDRYGLSPQETRVAHFLVCGHTNQQIAERLGVSPHTARHHTAQVLKKVDAHSRTEAVARLLRILGP